VERHRRPPDGRLQPQLLDERGLRPLDARRERRERSQQLEPAVLLARSLAGDHLLAHRDRGGFPVVRETQPPVAHLTSSNPNATTIALAWDNRAQYGGGISFGGYAVESSTNGGGWAIVTVITNASNRSATLSGLDPTASYSFRVATTDVCCGGSPVTTTSNTVNYSAVPPMGASASVRPASADVGQALNFTCTGRGGLPPYSYTWNFGDGTTATGQTASHAYGTPGPYSATCTVQDSRGYSATAPPRA
jgi:hypothetical protein